MQWQTIRASRRDNNNSSTSMDTSNSNNDNSRANRQRRIRQMRKFHRTHHQVNVEDTNNPPEEQQQPQPPERENDPMSQYYDAMQAQEELLLSDGVESRQEIEPQDQGQVHEVIDAEQAAAVLIENARHEIQDLMQSGRMTFQEMTSHPHNGQPRSFRSGGMMTASDDGTHPSSYYEGDDEIDEETMFTEEGQASSTRFFSSVMGDTTTDAATRRTGYSETIDSRTTANTEDYNHNTNRVHPGHSHDDTEYPDPEVDMAALSQSQSQTTNNSQGSDNHQKSNRDFVSVLLNHMSSSAEESTSMEAGGASQQQQHDHHFIALQQKLQQMDQLSQKQQDDVQQIMEMQQALQIHAHHQHPLMSFPPMTTTDHETEHDNGNDDDNDDDDDNRAVSPALSLPDNSFSYYRKLASEGMAKDQVTIEEGQHHPHLLLEEQEDQNSADSYNSFHRKQVDPPPQLMQPQDGKGVPHAPTANAQQQQQQQQQFQDQFVVYRRNLMQQNSGQDHDDTTTDNQDQDPNPLIHYQDLPSANTNMSLQERLAARSYYINNEADDDDEGGDESTTNNTDNGNHQPQMSVATSAAATAASDTQYSQDDTTEVQEEYTHYTQATSVGGVISPATSKENGRDKKRHANKAQQHKQQLEQSLDFANMQVQSMSMSDDGGGDHPHHDAQNNNNTATGGGSYIPPTMSPLEHRQAAISSRATTPERTNTRRNHGNSFYDEGDDDRSQQQPSSRQQLQPDEVPRMSSYNSAGTDGTGTATTHDHYHRHDDDDDGMSSADDSRFSYRIWQRRLAEQKRLSMLQTIRQNTRANFCAMFLLGVALATLVLLIVAKLTEANQENMFYDPDEDANYIVSNGERLLTIDLLAFGLIMVLLAGSLCYCGMATCNDNRDVINIVKHQDACLATASGRRKHPHYRQPYYEKKNHVSPTSVDGYPEVTARNHHHRGDNESHSDYHDLGDPSLSMLSSGTERTPEGDDDEILISMEEADQYYTELEDNPGCCAPLAVTRTASENLTEDEIEEDDTTAPKQDEKKQKGFFFFLARPTVPVAEEQQK